MALQRNHMNVSSGGHFDCRVITLLSAYAWLVLCPNVVLALQPSLICVTVNGFHRFLTSAVTLVNGGHTELRGVKRMHERPIGEFPWPDEKWVWFWGAG